MVCLLDLERNNHKISCSLLYFRYLLAVHVNHMLGKVKVNALTITQYGQKFQTSRSCVANTIFIAGNVVSKILGAL